MVVSYLLVISYACWVESELTALPSEFTPYELWCEELGSGIPSWGVGKKYTGGRSVPRKDGLWNPEC